MAEDYIDLAAEERAIRLGLDALQSIYDHPVRQDDAAKCLMIAEAIRTLEKQKQRAEEDMIFLRQEFEKVCGEGVKLSAAMERAKRSGWLTRLLGRGRLNSGSQGPTLSNFAGS